MDDYLNICVSQDIFDIQSLDLNSVHKPCPLLGQFTDRDVQIAEPRYISDGEDGIVFSLVYKNFVGAAASLVRLH